MPWWVASILANVMIAAIEYLNRVGGYPNFGHAILRTAPLIAVAQYGLWKAWSGAPSMMFAWAFFSAGNVLLRVISTYYFVGEPMGWKTTAGMLLVFGGAWLVKEGG